MLLPYLIVCRNMRWTSALIFTAVVWIALFFGLDLLMQFKLWKGAVPELLPGWVGGEIVPGSGNRAVRVEPCIEDWRG